VRSGRRQHTLRLDECDDFTRERRQPSRLPPSTASLSGTDGAIYVHARGIGEKVSPVEQTRRRFSKRIEEGDTVEIADDLGEYVACGEF